MPLPEPKLEPEKSFDFKTVVKPELLEDNVTGTLKTVSNLSLKEVIDGMNEENEHMEDANGEFLYSARGSARGTDEIFQSEDQEDPIFDLFDAGWHMSPRALSSTSASMKSPDCTI
ncbi:hypothetical protein L1987_62023 [Smallanthus sonchifolius]|uniref:Uncharacterized protein n=1 Tax=Smallanthus sonchifolius TaxID=185202 RepID=A0ACB9C9F0_9ASTR|nr:hypothetical protein L1987_62023 [Smallanthus sonchifolius]